MVRSSPTWRACAWRADWVWRPSSSAGPVASGAWACRIEPETASRRSLDTEALAEALLKYTFAALLKEREEDLAFFDQRIEKGLVAKLEGIVGSEFVHMDYGEAIRVLERANEKFEFPVNWGVDLQSEHERYLTEKYAKKPVIVMNYPKDIKAFYMRVNDDDRTVTARNGSKCWTGA